MIATLPMYDRRETEAANDRLWALVREQLPNAPEVLTRDSETHWTDPDLLLSQSCSLPFRTALRGKVTLVATPVHDLPCPPGFYFSALVARRDDRRDTFSAFHGARLAINGPDSQSGWAAAEKAARMAPIDFDRIAVTGAHRESARAVAEGQADLAAIDAVTWTMIRRWDGFAAALKVVANTPPTPALPYITALGNEPAPIRNALARAVDVLAPEDREALCLSGIADVTADTYFALPLPETPCLLP